MNVNKLVYLLSFLFLTSYVFAEIDPLKDLNQKTHNLNQTLDLQVASPIARFYQRITPDFIEMGVTNFTQNVEDLSIGVNNILQGKIKSGFSDLGRFTINSTIGIAGFLDIASDIGLEKHDEDFGQTLAVWGVPDGPYLVLPGLGPSTM